MTGLASRYTKDLLADRIDKEGFQIGAFTYGLPNVHSFNSGCKLRIGRYCSIAGAVHIFLGGNHRTDWVTTYPFSANPSQWPEAKNIKGHPSSNGDVNIGSDVWLASHCMIMSGVSIGHGCAVATGAIVTKDVPSYAIVGGNPARILRFRFSEDLILRLLAAKWWDLPEEEVRRLMPLLMSAGVETLLRELETDRQ